MFSLFFFSIKKKAKTPFSSTFFKRIEKDVEKDLKTTQDQYKLQKLRKEMLKFDVDKSLNSITEKSILTSIEKRVWNCDFNNTIELEDIYELKNSIKNSHLNLMSLFYCDIEDVIKNISKTIKYNPTYSHVFYSSGYFDNRLITTTMNFYDELWRLGLPIFKEVFDKIFGLSSPFIEDELCFDLEYEGVKECKKIFTNLLKCSSIYYTNKLFKKNVIKTTQIEEEDDDYSLDFYNMSIKNTNIQFIDKIHTLFPHYEFEKKDFEKILKMINLKRKTIIIYKNVIITRIYNLYGK